MYVVIFIWSFCFVIVVMYFSSGVFFFFKQKTAYEMRISDWSSDVCSSDLLADRFQERGIGFGSRACGDREAGGKRGRDRAQQVGVAEKQPGLRIVRDIADLGRRTVPVDRRQIGADMLRREREFDNGKIGRAHV